MKNPLSCRFFVSGCKQEENPFAMLAFVWNFSRTSLYVEKRKKLMKREARARRQCLMKPFIMKNDIKKVAKEKFSVLSSSSYSSFFPMKTEKVY